MACKDRFIGKGFATHIRKYPDEVFDRNIQTSHYTAPKKNISTGSPSTSTTFPCGIKKVEDPSSAGGSLLGQIVGGKISTPGAWPWQVAIMCKTCKEQDCGGTLVSAQHVITAAHCLSINKDTFIENYKVTCFALLFIYSFIYLLTNLFIYSQI